MKLDQAGKVIGGSVEPNSPCAPFSSTSAIFGNLPSATHGLIKSKVAPSQPMINTRVIEFTFKCGRSLGIPLLDITQCLKSPRDQFRLLLSEAMSDIRGCCVVGLIIEAL